MTRSRWGLAVVLLAGSCPALPAQVFVPGGVSFRYQSRHLTINGHVGRPPVVLVPVYPAPIVVSPYPPPFGIIERRITIINPTVVIAPPRGLPVEEPDVSGVDLDVVPAAALWKDVDPKDRPPVVAAVRKEPPPRLPPPAPPKPKVEENRHPLELGTRAFRDGEYGVASLRFTQATEVEPMAGRAYFLLGQAQYALGKYHDAVRSIEAGLKRAPDWPRSDFRPRDELYADQPAAWVEQRGRLEQAHKRQPDDGDFLFLLGYLAWFDGQQKEAVDWFRKARPRLAEPRWVDLFLDRVVAAR